MGRLTAAEVKRHNEALALLAKDTIRISDREQIFEKYNEGADHTTRSHGAFFTPHALARMLVTNFPEKARILDLCAGIGILGFNSLQHYEYNQGKGRIVCVEKNPTFVEHGQTLVPEATWICGDIGEIWKDLPNDFDIVISNPPFGKAPMKHGPNYKGPAAELKVVDIASQLGNHGVLILPQASTPFRISGSAANDLDVQSPTYERFHQETGITFNSPCLDTSFADQDWRYRVPTVEFVTADFRSVNRVSMQAALPFVDTPVHANA